MSEHMVSMPLSGIRVADFSWVAAGPWCARYLGTMGAEVIKIESTHRLDMTRKTGPFAHGMTGINQSAYYNMWNQSKKCCTLNLSTEKGKEIAKKIVTQCDVAVENFGYGTMQKMGLGYEELCKARPDIIMVSSSGFGRNGPHKEYLAYGRNVQAASGLAYLTGNPNASMGVTVIWSDILTGLTSAFTILLALRHRTRTGKGQYIDVSMLESTVMQLPEYLMDIQMNHRDACRAGNLNGQSAPCNCYRCAGDDKWVAIEVSNEKWDSFCEAMGNPDWCKNPSFATIASRLENQERLDQMVTIWTKRHTPNEITAILQRLGISASPSFDLDDLLKESSLYDRGTLVYTDHPEMGHKVSPGLQWITSDIPAFHKHAPLLGENNNYVFGQLLGMNPEEINLLIMEGVIS